METYTNDYTGEEFDDYDDCVQSILEYQADIVTELREVMDNYLESSGNDIHLCRAWDYLEECLSYADDMIEVGDDGIWEELIEKHMNVTVEE